MRCGVVCVYGSKQVGGRNSLILEGEGSPALSRLIAESGRTLPPKAFQNHAPSVAIGLANRRATAPAEGLASDC
mgnify:CR=1 FL=1